jgi:hypothetical protein
MSQRAANQLRIAPGLRLDADYVGGGTFALLAKKGAGKTYTGRVMAEEMWAARVPFVALDPMDAWWGLRSSADGESDGIPVAVFGGPHSDAPLERTGGALMADLVVDEGLSMVLSLKHFGTRAAERQFAMDFLERLYRRNSELVHLFIDEADLFAPQKPYAGDQPLLGVTENIVRRGRNNGIGVTLITQRPAVLNKDVLTQVDGLVAMRMLGPQDRAAIDAWVGEHGDATAAADVKGTLPELGNGESWWWVPEQGILRRVQVRKSRTFDSSPTRKRGGGGAREPKSFADIDMGAIEQKMAATIERAKADDPKELRARIRALERQLAERPATEPETRVVWPFSDEELDRTIESAELALTRASEANVRAEQLLRDADSASLDIGEFLCALRAWRERRDAKAESIDELIRVATGNRAARGRPPSGRDDTQQRKPPRADEPGAGPPRVAAPRGARAPGPEANGTVLKAGARRMLAAVASLHPMPLTRAQVGTLAKVKRTGGTFSTYLGLLKQNGYVVEEADRLSITEAGFDALGTAPPAPATPDELRAMWRDRLKAGARRMLDVLIDRHPDWLRREELADAAGITMGGGTFSTYLGMLRTAGLIDEESGRLRAADVLFIGAHVCVVVEP